MGLLNFHRTNKNIICLFFRVGTYSSGPLPTPSSSQPPSLGIPPSPAVPPPPTGPPLFPLSNYPPEPSMKTSSQVSSQPLTSGSGVLSYPHSAAMTRLVSTRRRYVCCLWFKSGACITKLYDRNWLCILIIWSPWKRQNKLECLSLACLFNLICEIISKTNTLAYFFFTFAVDNSFIIENFSIYHWRRNKIS